MLEILLGLFDREAEIGMVVLYTGKGPIIRFHDACVEHLLLASNTDDALFGNGLVWGAIVIGNECLS